MFSYWPLPKRIEKLEGISIKNEVLLEGVSSLEFEFYIAEASKKKPEQPGKPSPTPEPEPKGDWRRQNPWLEEFRQLPAMIRIIVNKSNGEEPMIFAFPLPKSRARINYE